MSVTSNQNTLTEQGYRDRLDDSLCGDEFEIIENEEQNAEPVFSPETIHWSIPNSIAMTPLLDRESLQLPNSANSSIVNQPTPAPAPTPVDNGHDSVMVDTSILSGTMTASLASMGSTDSEKLMMSLQQQLSETKDTLVKIVMQADTFKKDADEIKELKEVNMALIKENANCNEYKNQLEQERVTLNKTIESLAAERDESTLRTASLEEDLNTAKLRLQCQNKQDNSNDKFVMEQLDVMCAKFLEEKERRLEAERLINSMTFGDSSRVLNSDTNVADNLREKRQQVDRLEEEKARMKTEFEKIQRENEDLKSTVETKDEIIRVLQQDHIEGTRLIAEGEHRIDELGRLLRGMQRAEVNNV